MVMYDNVFIYHAYHIALWWFTVLLCGEIDVSIHM